MITQWRIVEGGARPVVVISLVILAACMKQAPGGVANPVPPEPQPAQTTPVVVPPAAPAPTPADIAFAEAGKAVSDGNHERAVILYANAATLSTDAERLAEINFALGLLHSDPNSVMRDVTLGRAELQKVIEGDGHPVLAREARIVAALLDELTQLRTQTTDQHAESEELKVRIGSLTEKLDQKEKELAEIKKILLQEKKKP